MSDALTGLAGMEDGWPWLQTKGAHGLQDPEDISGVLVTGYHETIFPYTASLPRGLNVGQGSESDPKI